MDVLTAKKEVIAAGERLVEAGLIARTWGNVSCRVDDKTFVITPSGKPYIGLTPDDIVEVAIDSLEWSGDVKPSSEKGIHAEVYKRYSDANFVIHTHQKTASAISVLKSGINTLTGENKDVIGDNILLASYGLPGTKKLRKGVTAALAGSPSKATVMAHHGALCFGRDADEAFMVADTLEKACAEYILDAAKAAIGKAAGDLDTFCAQIVSKLAGTEKSLDIDKSMIYNSECDRASGKIILTNLADGAKISMDMSTGAADTQLADTAEAHRSIYLAAPAMNYIIHNVDKETVGASILGKTMKPLLDDFSQICGTKVRVAKTPAACGKKIKGKNAVILKDKGALCCGKNEGDAEAVNMIMSKASLALLTTKVLDGAKPINPLEAFLMRFIYLKKYSKQAEK
ncbi:MAG: class II aldolase/adducin family protein [Clostridia bacterium]|nr:class II aldolase/adducin family protein [Clostridia bacterium]